MGSLDSDDVTVEINKDSINPIQTKIAQVKHLGQLNEKEQVEMGLRDAIHPLIGYVNEHGFPDDPEGQELCKEFGDWFNKVRIYLEKNDEAHMQRDATS